MYVCGMFRKNTESALLKVYTSRTNTVPEWLVLNAERCRLYAHSTEEAEMNSEFGVRVDEGWGS